METRDGAGEFSVRGLEGREGGLRVGVGGAFGGEEGVGVGGGVRHVVGDRWLMWVYDVSVEILVVGVGRCVVRD